MDFYQDNLFKQLLGELISEPYSKVCFFHLKSLETVCQEMGQDSELIGKEHPLFLSFERTKNTLCLVLSHLELSGVQEFPKGAIATFFGTEFSGASHQSPAVSTLIFLKHLKLTGQFPVAPTHLDKLIGLQLFMELEDRCVSSMESLFRKWNLAPSDFGLRPNPADLNEVLICLTAALSLPSDSMPPQESLKTLLSKLSSIERQKREALSLRSPISTNWLSQLEKTCDEALRCLESLLESEKQNRRAA